jgi:hypothetical protein
MAKTRGIIGGGKVKETPTSRILSMSLTMPNMDMSTPMDRMFAKVNNVFSMGEFIKLGGVVMIISLIYSATLECWNPLGSSTGTRMLSGIVGADNATVNYDVAVKPYVPLIAQHAQVANADHQSVCLGLCGWLVEVEEDELRLRCCHKLVEDGNDGCLAKVTRRQCPVGPRSVCTRLRNIHHCHVSERFSCLFKIKVEYETLLFPCFMLF